MRILPSLARLGANLIGPRKATRLYQRLMPTYLLLRYHDRLMFDRIGIEITTFCSRRCWYCSYSVAPPEVHDMDAATYSSVVKRLAEFNWREPAVLTVYGEPMYRMELPDMIADMRRNTKALPTLYSNGDYATMESCERLVKAGLWRCGFTNHPPTPLGWVERISAIVKRWPTIFGIQVIEKKIMCNHGGSLKHLIPPNRNPCPPMFPIRWNGNVSLCCNDYNFSTNFGNINEKSIKEIWSQPRLRKLHSDLRKNPSVRVLQMCKDCNVMCED